MKNILLILVFLGLYSCSSSNVAKHNYVELSQSDTEFLTLQILDVIAKGRFSTIIDTVSLFSFVTYRPKEYYSISDRHDFYHPIVNFDFQEMDFKEAAMPVILEYEYKYWKENILRLTFHFPMVNSNSEILVLLKQFYMGAQWDYLYTFEEINERFKLKHVFQTVRHYGHVRNPLDTAKAMDYEKYKKMVTKLIAGSKKISTKLKKNHD